LRFILLADLFSVSLPATGGTAAAETAAAATEAPTAAHG